MISNGAASGQRIRALDGLRGLAVLMVLGIHFLYARFFPEPPPVTHSVVHILQFGWMGVDLFLVLSGFLITGILVDTRGSPNFFRSFYARRALRIFPLYYLVVLAALTTLPFQRSHPFWVPSIPDASTWVPLLLYFSNWWSALAHRDPGYFGLFWTLAIEEQFYLLWPFLIFWLKPPAFLRLCLSICFVVPCLRLVLELRDANSFFVFTNTFTRADSLVWGALAALFLRSPAAWLRFKQWLPLGAGVSFATILIIDFPLHDFYQRAFPTQTVGFSVIAVGFAALLLLAWQSDHQDGRLAKILRSPILTQFGRYSYGIYILHSFILLWFSATFHSQAWAGHSLPIALLAYLAFNLACLLSAAVSFHAYEKHFLKLKRYFVAQAAVIKVK